MPIGQLGMMGLGFAGKAIDTGMGLLLENHNDKRQIEQQRKLTDIQSAANKDMARFNTEQQMKMWHDTNYSAQMEELNKAGLNAGLLYGMSGGGATTTGNPGGSGVSGGSAPTGGGEVMGLMNGTLQTQMLQAQTENVKSQTELNKVEAAKKAGVDTDLTRTQTESLSQGIQNQKAVEELTKAQTELKKIETTVAGETQENVIAAINTQTNIIYQELRSAQAAGDIDQSTVQARIKTANAMAIGAVLNNELTRARTSESRSNVEVNKAQIDKMAADIAQKWDELEYTGDKVSIEKRRVAIEAYINDMPKSFQMTQQAISGILSVLPKIK